MMNLGSFETDNNTGKISGVFYGVNMVPTKLIFEPATSEKGQSVLQNFCPVPTRDRRCRSRVA